MEHVPVLVNVVVIFWRFLTAFHNVGGFVMSVHGSQVIRGSVCELGTECVAIARWCVNVCRWATTCRRHVAVLSDSLFWRPSSSLLDCWLPLSPFETVEWHPSNLTTCPSSEQNRFSTRCSLDILRTR